MVACKHRMSEVDRRFSGYAANLILADGQSFLLYSFLKIESVCDVNRGDWCNATTDNIAVEIRHAEICVDAVFVQQLRKQCSASSDIAVAEVGEFRKRQQYMTGTVDQTPLIGRHQAHRPEGFVFGVGDRLLALLTGMIDDQR